MLIFLDTNIISYYLNDCSVVKEELRKAMRNQETICTTLLNVYEILKGFKWKNNKQKEKRFNIFLNDLDIYSINDNVIKIATDIYSTLRKKGVTIEDIDILIAAIVIANDGILVTNNTKHFGNIKQLKVVNWVC